MSLHTVTVDNTVPDTAAFMTSDQAFVAWQEAETAWTELSTQGVTTHNINALNQHSEALMQAHDNTQRDGAGNQSNSSLRLSEWIDQVNGSDIVSQAQYQAGFTITGRAAAGLQATIQWRLDKDRTDGVDGQGAQVLHLGANDVDGDGITDVTTMYDNTSGEWRLNFAANSHALQSATHNIWGSGVHQLIVDNNGNATKEASEPSRLFLVADGTAQTTDTGLVSQNYSVQDRITGDVFVYYYGDPDGAAGTSFWTPLDSDDTAPKPV